MSDYFEDHCWKDIVTPDILEVYACYKRETFVGTAPALLAIDLYELVYRGGPHRPHEIAKEYPNACGCYAYEAIEPTKRLFAAARARRSTDLLFDRRRASREPPVLRQRYQARKAVS